MMADGDGLAALKVGVAGYNDSGVPVRLGEQGTLQAGAQCEKAVNGGAAVEAGVGSDLVITAARSV